MHRERNRGGQGDREKKNYEVKVHNIIMYVDMITKQLSASQDRAHTHVSEFLELVDLILHGGRVHVVVVGDDVRE